MHSPDRFFNPEPACRIFACQLYESVARRSIVSLHGHLGLHLFANPDASFGSPADLSIMSDHFMMYML